LRTLDIIVGWLLIALGAVHTSLTWRVDPNLGINAIWFACGGLFMITIGVLNLLRVAYGAVARGIYVVCFIANLVLVLLMLWIASRVPMRSNPQVVVGLIIAALLAAFALLRRSSQIQAHQVQSAK
jgi:hypothetical protein